MIPSLYSVRYTDTNTPMRASIARIIRFVMIGAPPRALRTGGALRGHRHCHRRVSSGTPCRCGVARRERQRAIHEGLEPVVADGAADHLVPDHERRRLGCPALDREGLACANARFVLTRVVTRLPLAHV